MNPLTGYLPVWLTPEQESEYKRLLGEHYEAEYYEFDDLPTSITQILPYSTVSAIVEGIQRRVFFSGTYNIWFWHQNTDEYPNSISLMKIE